MDVNVLSSSLNSEDSRFFFQSVQLGLLVNSWGYGWFVFFFLYWALVFQVDFDFYYSGWFIAVGFRFYLYWVVGRALLGILDLYRVYSFICGRASGVLGILDLYRVYSIFRWAFIPLLGVSSHNVLRCVSFRFHDWARTYFCKGVYR
jgi:hypothetical protein